MELSTDTRYMGRQRNGKMAIGLLSVCVSYDFKDRQDMAESSSKPAAAMGLKRRIQRESSKQNLFSGNRSASESQGTTTASLGGIIRAARVSRLWKQLTLSRHSSTTVGKQTKATIENSYRMEPKNGERFREKDVIGILKEVLETSLKHVVYNNILCKVLSKDMSNVINERVKALHIPRYKFVCHVLIAEGKGQAIEVVSRCLWDNDTDNVFCATYSNETLTAVANVFTMFYE